MTIINSTSRVIDPGADTPESVKARISPERWRDFHEGRSILIVDDNPDTASHLKNSLADLYDKISICTDPKEVIERIAEAAEAGTPYDAVVLDLYMPEMPGPRILKELASFEQEIPAIVINTASLMNGEVVTLSRALDRYRSEQALKAAQEIRDDFGQEVPLMVHNKLEPLTVLVQKIDAALLLNETGPGTMREALKSYDPLLVPTEYTAEAVHSFCEHTRNYVLKFDELVSLLSKIPSVQESSWGEDALRELRGAASELRNVTFTRLFTDNPEETQNRMHDILGKIQRTRIERFTIPDDDGPSGDESLATRRALSENYRDFVGRLNAIHNGLRDFYSPTVSVDDFWKEVGRPVDPNPRSVTSFFPDYPVGDIRDPERNLRTAVSEIIKALVRYGEEANVYFHTGVYKFPEESRKHDRAEQKQALDKLNAGDYLQINFSCTEPPEGGVPWEKILEPLLPRMSQLLFAKQLAWNAMSGNHSEFRLYIKVSDAVRDFEAEAKQKVIKTSDGKRTLTDDYGEIDVQEDLGEDRNIVLIGKALSPDVTYSRSPVIIEHEGKLLISAESSHGDGCHRIRRYLLALAKLGELSTDTTIPSANTLYQGCFRLRTYDENVWVEPSSEAGDELVSKALVQLGFQASNIKFEHFGFAERPDIF